MADLELLHLTFSHFNEKARWALDFKGVRHRRRGFDVLGPHAEPARALTGATEMPILVVDGEPVAGSSEIVAWLEAQHPEPALYPHDEAERAEALALEAHLCSVLGPAIRWFFVIDVMAHPTWAAENFLGARAAHIKVSPGDEEAPRQITEEALDRVAAADPYLVGDTFSVADLTAASLLSMALYPPGFPFDLPDRDVPPLSRWFARYQDHPGVAWVERMYAQHRGSYAGA